MSKASSVDHTDIISLTELVNITPAEALKILAARANATSPYTWLTERILVATRPLAGRSFPLYDQASLKAYDAESVISSGVEPHVFAVMSRAVEDLRRSRVPQLIMATGESGSGKSFTVQKAIDWLAANIPSIASLADTEPVPLHTKLAAALAFADLFGNAATTKNNDSSRFCKMISISLDNMGNTLVSARLDYFLMEETRVAHPTGANYHILRLVYKINEARHSFTAQQPRLLPPAAPLEEPKPSEALRTLRQFLAEDKLDHLMDVLAAILHLGDIACDTDSSDHQALARDFHLVKAANLLGLTADKIASVLAPPSLCRDLAPIKTTSTTKVKKARDSLITHIYVSTMQAAIDGINATLSAKVAFEAPLNLVVMDMCGFEAFKNFEHSTEQLFMNTANEAIAEVFKLEGAGLSNQEEQNIGGISLTLQKICELLDEQSQLGLNGTEQHTDDRDMAFLRAARKELEAIQGKSALHSSTHFDIRHYAANVRYTAKGSVARNDLTAGKAIVELVQESVLGKISVKIESSVGESSKRPTRKRLAGGRFLTSLRQLLHRFCSHQKHWICCIRLDSEELPKSFDQEHCLAQMAACSMIETIDRLRMAWTIQIPFSSFAQRYGLILSDTEDSMQPRPLHKQVEDILAFTMSGKDVEAMLKIELEVVFLRGDGVSLLDSKLASSTKKLAEKSPSTPLPLPRRYTPAIPATPSKETTFGRRQSASKYVGHVGKPKSLPAKGYSRSGAAMLQTPARPNRKSRPSGPPSVAASSLDFEAEREALVKRCEVLSSRLSDSEREAQDCRADAAARQGALDVVQRELSQQTKLCESIRDKASQQAGRALTEHAARDRTIDEMGSRINSLEKRCVIKDQTISDLEAKSAAQVKNHTQQLLLGAQQHDREYVSLAQEYLKFVGFLPRDRSDEHTSPSPVEVADLIARASACDTEDDETLQLAFKAMKARCDEYASMSRPYYFMVVCARGLDEHGTHPVLGPAFRQLREVCQQILLQRCVDELRDLLHQWFEIETRTDHEIVEQLEEFLAVVESKAPSHDPYRIKDSLCKEVFYAVRVELDLPQYSIGSDSDQGGQAASLVRDLRNNLRMRDDRGKFWG